MTCSLEKEEDVNYNTKLFTFKLPGASHMIVPAGHHISIKVKDKQGSYTCTHMYENTLHCYCTNLRYG